MTLLLPEEKIQGIRGITSGFDKTNRNSFFNHSNSVPSLPTFLLFQKQQILSLKPAHSYLTLVKLTPMAKNELLWWVNNLGTLQWPIGYTTTEAGPYSDRCIQKRLMGCMSRDQNKGSMFQEGTGSAYQSAGTFSHKVCHLDIYENVENVSYTYPGRQHDSLDLFAENGRDKECRTNADLKENLGVSTWVRDHDYCRTFTRESQLQGRLGFSAPERFLGMEAVSSNFQQNMPKIGEETRNRPVCFKVVKSASRLLLLEAGCQKA